VGGWGLIINIIKNNTEALLAVNISQNWLRNEILSKKPCLFPTDEKKCFPQMRCPINKKLKNLSKIDHKF
jgi:hypothetical protein